MKYALWITYDALGEEQDLPWASEDIFETEDEAQKAMDFLVSHAKKDARPRQDYADFEVIVSIEQQNDSGTQFEVIHSEVVYTCHSRRMAERRANELHDAYSTFCEERGEL